jgi:ankyrin repeat protein
VMLLQCRAEIQDPNFDGLTPLHMAAMNSGASRAAEILIDAGTLPYCFDPLISIDAGTFPCYFDRAVAREIYALCSLRKRHVC